jgi:hypothetical protein
MPADSIDISGLMANVQSNQSPGRNANDTQKKLWSRKWDEKETIEMRERPANETTIRESNAKETKKRRIKWRFETQMT